MKIGSERSVVLTFCAKSAGGGCESPGPAPRTSGPSSRSRSRARLRGLGRRRVPPCRHASTPVGRLGRHPASDVAAMRWPVNHQRLRPAKTGSAVKRSRFLSPRGPEERARTPSRSPSSRAPSRPWRSLRERCPGARRARRAPKVAKTWGGETRAAPEIALRRLVDISSRLRRHPARTSAWLYAGVGRAGMRPNLG